MSEPRPSRSHASAERAAEALAHDALVQSWPEITRLAHERARPQAGQATAFGEKEY